MHEAAGNEISLPPILCSVPQASAMIGRGTQAIYELIGSGKIRAVKSDGRTLIVVEIIARVRCQSAARKSQAPAESETPTHEVTLAPQKRRAPASLATWPTTASALAWNLEISAFRLTFDNVSSGKPEARPINPFARPVSGSLGARRAHGRFPREGARGTCWPCT